MERGRQASREPQAYMATLAAQRQSVLAGDGLVVARDLHVAALDLTESVALHRLARHAEVIPCAERAREVFDRTARTTPNPSLARELHMFSATCLLQVGNACHGRSMLADALRAYHAVRERYTLLGELKGESTALQNIALCYQLSGLKHLAVQAALEAREIVGRLGDPTETATLDYRLGVLHGENREFDAARVCLERAVQYFERDGRGDYDMALRLELAMLCREEGKIEEAFRWLESAAEVSRRIERRELEADRLIVLGRVLCSAGRHDEARPVFEEGLRLAREVDDSDRVSEAALELGALALRDQRAADARVAGELALEASRRNGPDHRQVPDALGLLADAARLAGEWEHAWRLERERQETAARLVKRAEDDRARTLAVRHQLDVIREESERRRLENRRLEEALAQVAARLDATEKRTAAAPDPESISAEHFRPLGLRPRECEVLLWVVRGKSNDEIALILGCSAETVKSHLKRIYTQLDVTNRTAAAASALARMAPPAA